jgi:hypothetical protein
MVADGEKNRNADEECNEAPEPPSQFHPRSPGVKWLFAIISQGPRGVKGVKN